MCRSSSSYCCFGLSLQAGSEGRDPKPLSYVLPDDTLAKVLGRAGRGGGRTHVLLCMDIPVRHAHVLGHEAWHGFRCAALACRALYTYATHAS